MFRIQTSEIPILSTYCSLPWNQSTLPGYFLEITLTLNFGEGSFIINASLLLLFVSICLHHETFHEIFRHTAAELDLRDQTGKYKKMVFRKLILFHTSAKK